MLKAKVEVIPPKGHRLPPELPDPIGAIRAAVQAIEEATTRAEQGDHQAIEEIRREVSTLKALLGME